MAKLVIKGDSIYNINVSVNGIDSKTLELTGLNLDVYAGSDPSATLHCYALPLDIQLDRCNINWNVLDDYYRQLPSDLLQKIQNLINSILIERDELKKFNL